MRYGPIEASVDSVQGANTWISVGLREGKNREVRRILAHLGVDVNRLIRTSYGPFQLLDLKPGQAEPVRRHVLADQMGAKLAAELNLNEVADEMRAQRKARNTGARRKTMRVVAGTLRGRAIAGPQHEGLRPTSDRVRESLFNILAHGIDDFSLEGARVIDLFAGTGALGIEAISRGAAYCLFVDSEPDARGLIRNNVEAFGLTGVTRIFRRDAADLGPAGTVAPFHLAFLDPPYDKGLGERALNALADGKWLVPGAIVVLEERASATIALPPAFVELDRRTYGDTQIVFARYATALGWLQRHQYPQQDVDEQAREADREHRQDHVADAHQRRIPAEPLGDAAAHAADELALAHAHQGLAERIVHHECLPDRDLRRDVGRKRSFWR